MTEGDFDDPHVQTFSQTFGVPYDAKKIKRVQVAGTHLFFPSLTNRAPVMWNGRMIAPGATLTEYQIGMLDNARLNLLLGLDAVMAASPSVDVVNLSSYTASEDDMAPSTLEIWHTKLLEMVTQGITGALPVTPGHLASLSHRAPQNLLDPYVLAVGE